MTLNIGRATFPDGTMPESWDLDGDGGLSISGIVRADTIEDAVQYRNQVLQLARNTDEEVVALTWTTDPQEDGWYRVASASAGTVATSYSSPWFPVDIKLQRVDVGGWGRFEALYQAGVAPGTDSGLIADVRVVRSVPEDAVEWVAASTGEWTRSTATGDLTTREGIASVTAYWTLLPEDAYVGACTVRSGEDAASLADLVGRDFRYGHTWEIHNGIISARNDAGDLGVSAWDGTDWVDLTFRIKDDTSTYFTVSDVVTVMRNAPHLSAIRVGLARASGVLAGDHLDITVRRGSPILHCRLSVSSTANMTVVIDPSMAATLTDDALVGDDDVDGLTPVLYSRIAVTQNSGNLSAKPASATLAWEFGLAATAAGDAHDAPLDLAEEWRALIIETPRLTRR